MKKALLVVDVQNDFVNGVLGTDDTRAVIPKLRKYLKSFDGEIVFTIDSHNRRNYSKTIEGKHIPFHCEERKSDLVVKELLPYKLRARLSIIKDTFACYPSTLLSVFRDYDEIVVVGLLTDICVVSNALLLRSLFPQKEITVVSECCVGSSSENHQSALNVMRSCLINVV